ncbi:hypothetical protein PHYSODRAFT_261393 [Phytophthora sojae]|uniref:Uncharacterized protein n=1 Tax=Phytophthora sojae (strain P6497) TaxID=1094619 RepID=G4ZDM4_PHYSP|nr:hypothetical protein PHYSODRAFT_261393 [Phytophthora sojae]EGZ18363.1 hypothetical protein PHYSODRAFT_261393 [Phytophthora sojae]|eukprot:XP_009527421.1 hypothetical protein PHYSODRAFT_261393 [Phytophthora sojae]
MTTPLLLLLQFALPPHIQAIPHVAQLINDFALPSTIDAAVYNDLQRVFKVFEGFRPDTVGAMDGAPAIGRLDIVQRLHHERDEGCSAATWKCWSGSTGSTRTCVGGCRSSRRPLRMATWTLSSSC